MAISAQYGMGTYNARLPSSNIRLPQTSGGVATPLAFFPSSNVQRGDVTESLDTSLSDMIGVYSGSDSGADASNSPAGSATSSNVSGMGFGSSVSSAVGKGVSTGLGFAGAPAAVAGLAGGIATGIAGRGISNEDMANLAMNAVAVALGVPGLAMTGLQALGFNPAQGLSEALGLSYVTPGYEGGFFGTPGIGAGISGSIGDVGIDTGPAPGYDVGDLGMGLSTTSNTGLFGEVADVGIATGNYAGLDSVGGIGAENSSFGEGYGGMDTESSYGDVGASNDSNTSSESESSTSDSDSDSDSSSDSY